MLGNNDQSEDVKQDPTDEDEEEGGKEEAGTSHTTLYLPISSPPSRPSIPIPYLRTDGRFGSADSPTSKASEERDQEAPEGDRGHPKEHRQEDRE